MAGFECNKIYGQWAEMDESIPEEKQVSLLRETLDHVVPIAYDKPLYLRFVVKGYTMTNPPLTQKKKNAIAVYYVGFKDRPGMDDRLAELGDDLLWCNDNRIPSKYGEGKPAC